MLFKSIYTYTDTQQVSYIINPHRKVYIMLIQLTFNSNETIKLTNSVIPEYEGTIAFASIDEIDFERLALNLLVLFHNRGIECLSKETKHNMKYVLKAITQYTKDTTTRINTHDNEGVLYPLVKPTVVFNDVDYDYYYGLARKQLRSIKECAVANPVFYDCANNHYTIPQPRKPKKD